VEVTIQLPDDIAASLQARWSNLPRGVLEAIAAAGYRSGDLTHAEVMRLLGLHHRVEVDAFLKQAGVFLDYDEQDLETDLRALDQLHGR